MKLLIELSIDGECVSDTPRGIVRQSTAGIDRILRPDFITLQTRTDDGRDSIVCQVTGVSIDGQVKAPPVVGHEQPEQYLFRLFMSYAKYTKRLKGEESSDKETKMKLADIASKIYKLCDDKHLPNPLRGVQ